MASRSRRRNPVALAERARPASPRARLTPEEAGRVLDRPVAEVRRAIRAGFLRAGRGGTVTLGACRRFLREEARDTAIQDRTLARLRTGRTRLIPWEVVRGRV